MLEIDSSMVKRVKHSFIFAVLYKKFKKNESVMMIMNVMMMMMDNSVPLCKFKIIIILHLFRN
jgi:hypothetical protein